MLFVLYIGENLEIAPTKRSGGRGSFGGSLGLRSADRELWTQMNKVTPKDSVSQGVLTSAPRSPRRRM